MIRPAVRGAIWVYQRTASPDHGVMSKARRGRRFCPQEPTCSQYAADVLAGSEALGPALRRIARRISSCGRAGAGHTPR